MLWLALAIVCITWICCGGGDKEETVASSELEKKAAPAETSTLSSPLEAGWKTGRIGDTGSISIPEDWGGDAEAQVWWPGTGDMSLGRPDVSLHCGGMPFMPGQSFEDKVQNFTGATPLAQENVTVDGMSGFKCVWESGGSTVFKHMGIFLEEKISGGIGVAHFADCRAPIGVYENHSAAFEKIVDSFRCKK